MKKNLSLWVLLAEILAIVWLHSNKDRAGEIKDILMQRNQSGLIKATPITAKPMHTALN
ncbi:hypothetical protein KJS94_07665 [Flavihumibacter rivuli]|uniref:hypothetical protein n=1 Tax=Flavihumibacter rivuli TaxID=2838156 RepID=UPI001BDF57BE|nr:hypothetical protein [Flavihumibacter rivuli]ULQ58078.1 hypothetical protein KJS94_07665 [Flavihumibacter rivuli]